MGRAGVSKQGSRVLSFFRMGFILLISLSLLSCGEVTFFLFVNTGVIDETRRSGLVLIVGTPREEEAKEVRLVEGEIPEGMEPKLNGTVEGIPEETGFFDFTVELTNFDGTTEILEFSIEVED